MSIFVECGRLVFPERVRVEDLEAEARIVLAWLKKDKY